MHEALKVYAPEDFAVQYQKGARIWENGDTATIDKWIADNDERNNQWLHTLLASNRETIRRLGA